MKKILTAFICLIICGSLLCGCSLIKEEETTTTVEETTTMPDSSIYGTWMEDYFDSGYTFNSDGTGIDIFWEYTFTYTTDGAGNVHIMYDNAELYGDTYYSYTTDGTTLTMIMEDDDTSYIYTKQ